MLEAGEAEVHKFISDGRLHGYKIGDDILRLRKEQVSELKAKWRIEEGGLFPPPTSEHPHAPPVSHAGVFDRARDFVYFNDFYIVSAVVVAALFYLILSSR